MAEMKLRADEKTFYYPDVFVSCDKTIKSAFYREEPVLIVEVVSPSTRQIDRREKLRVYQQIPTVQEYVVIEQDKMLVEIHRRQADGRWITYFYNEGDLDEEIAFQSVELKLTLEEIYDRVRFED
jgi:Uma2 family endonuclease